MSPSRVSPLVVALVLSMTLVGFCVSAMTLTALGIAYDAPGGNALHKLHPATFIAALAFLARVTTDPQPLAYLAGLPSRFPGVAFFCVMWTMTIAYAVLEQSAPIMPLFDTFFFGMVFLVLFDEFDDEARGRLRILVHAVMIANAALGIIEFATHWRLTPFVTGGAAIEHDYRSTALFGHPLLNAATTAAYIVALVYRADKGANPLLFAGVIALQGVAMVAFGGRTAIVLTLALVGFHALRRLVGIARGGRFDMRAAGLALTAAPVVLALAALAYRAGYLDEIVSRFTNDKGSTQARVVLYDLFDYFSIEDLLFGPDPQQLATAQNTLGIEYGVENSWIGFLFQYGALMTGAFVAGFLALYLEIWRRAAAGRLALTLMFFVEVTSAAAISVKSFEFNHFVVIVLALAGARASKSAVDRAVASRPPYLVLRPERA
ncbi:MAG: VpsF family polysaccharide biosynthesis protein [Hyphomicrobiales bacterium]|nr:VpsF family polysaccharide biosynthesis protein [Hyphomicrobiales bacterium]